MPPRQSSPPGVPSGVTYDSTFPASTDGFKTWDLNSDGVAHYGMLWDFVRDVRLLSADVIDNQFMYGADYFYQTWKLAETQSVRVR